jgi:hypothetical protein
MIKNIIFIFLSFLLLIGSGLTFPEFNLLDWVYFPGMVQSAAAVSLNAEETQNLYIPLVKVTAYPVVFGVETNAYLPGDTQDLATEARVYWVRRNALLWSDVEPTRGARNWQAVSQMEQELRDSSEQGKKLILIVRGTPAWARQYPNSPCGPIRDDAIADFANFMADLVNRYSQAPYNLVYIEVWNEPDAPVMDVDEVYGCWGNVNDTYYGGRYFAKVLKQAYPKIHSVNADVKVVVGGLLMDCDPNNPPVVSGQKKDCRGSRYLEGILKAGGAPYFDAVSFHAYDYYQGAIGVYNNYNWHSAYNTTGPTLIAKARYLKDLLTRYGASNKEVILSEVSLLCEDGCDDNFQTTKAYFVAQVYASAIVESLDGVLWYHLHDVWRNAGLVSMSQQPYPAYQAYKFAREVLNTAAGGKDVSQGKVRMYEIYSSNRVIRVAWSLDGIEHEISLPYTPLAGFDTFGNSIPVSLKMLVGKEPIYLEMDRTDY